MESTYDYTRFMLSVEKVVTKRRKFLRYHFNFNIPNTAFEELEGNKRCIISRSIKGLYADIVIVLKSPIFERFFCDFKDNGCFQILGLNGILDVKVRCDSYEQWRYIQGAKMPNEILYYKEFQNQYISVNVTFRIRKKDFLSCIKNTRKTESKSKKTKQIKKFERDTSLKSIFTASDGIKSHHYKGYGNAFRPYSGGRFTPK